MQHAFHVIGFTFVITIGQRFGSGVFISSAFLFLVIIDILVCLAAYYSKVKCRCSSELS